MIGWLSGNLLGSWGSRVLIDTGGVGYEVEIPTSLMPSLGNLGESVELFIHTQVREDNITLYGFPTRQDRDIFLSLTSVSGVGAKSAMAILSVIPSGEVVTAIRSKNPALLSQAKGVGRKAADRIIVELVDKFKEMGTATLARPGLPEHRQAMQEDVISALMNLGYKRSAAELAVAKVDLSKSDSFDTIFRKSLHTLAP